MASLVLTYVVAELLNTAQVTHVLTPLRGPVLSEIVSVAMRVSCYILIVDRIVNKRQLDQLV